MNSFELDISMIQYESYLIEREMCNYQLQLFVLESGNLTDNNYIIIRESVLSKLKEWFDKLINLWHTFKDKIKSKFDAVALSNDSILKKYKDLITTKPFKGTVTIYNYNTKLFNDNKVPQFNYESFKDIENLSEELKSRYFNIYDRANGDTFKDKIINALHNFSEMKEYKDQQVDLKHMYDACISIKAWSDEIQKNIDIVESACNNAKNKLKNEPINNQKEDVKSESSILEADDDKQKFSINSNDDTNKNDNSDNKNNDKQSNNINNVINSAMNNNDKSSSENDLLYKCIAAYHKVCSDYLTTKSTILYQIQSEYMAVIRQHIKSYNGNLSSDNNNIDKANTDNLAKNVKKDVDKYNSTNNDNEKASIRTSIYNKFKKLFGDKADNMTNKVLKSK